MSDPILGTFHDAQSGATFTRELTAEEIAELPNNPETWPSE